MVALAVVSLAFVSVSAAEASIVPTVRSQQGRPTIGPEVDLSPGSLIAEARDRALGRAMADKRQRGVPAGALAKLKGNLGELRSRVAAEAMARQAAPSRAGGGSLLQLQDLSQPLVARVAADGAIHVYVHTKSDPAVAVDALKALGMRVELTAPTLRIIQGWLPHDRMETAAALDAVERITLPDYAMHRTGSVTSEGDALLKANLVRQMGSPGPYTGAGIKIGIISDGMASLPVAVASGDLPATVTINPFMRGSGNEGTAMAEIVHDLAPDAQIYFAGPTTSAEMVTAIQWLVLDGCHVICDDVGFYTEQYFGYGPAAFAVRDAVSTSGKVYVAAAGNDALNHYQGGFTDAGNGFHDFKVGPGVDTSLDISVPAGGSTSVYLQWDDPFGVSSNDYDLYLVDPSDGTIVSRSEGPQNGDDNPLEVVSWHNSSSSSKTLLAGIVLYRGLPKLLELFVVGGQVVDDDAVADDSIFGQAAVAEAISCAAINAGSPGLGAIAAYSSRGPSTFWGGESHQTPFITGLDGVAVSDLGGSFPNPFYGTSAASPHVAAICALMLQRNPLYTPSQIRAALAALAADRGVAGRDFIYGYGLVDALAAVNQVQLTPPVITSQPQSQAVLAGTAIAFSIAATSEYPLTYQWQRQAAGASGFSDLLDGSDYRGATTATLTIAAGTAVMNGDQFRCNVSYYGATLPSSAATLTVRVAPVFTSLNSATFATRTIGSFVVAATGLPAPTFSVVGGNFPTWATLNASSGAITGQPPDANSSPFTFVLEAANAGGSSRQTFTLSVNTVPSVIAVSAHAFHALFLRADGSVWGMGNNASGQLGDGTRIQRTVAIPIDSGAVALSTGVAHSLFLKADDSLWAVGDNSAGQYGDGTRISQLRPTRVATEIIAAAAGGDFSLFLKRDGSLWSVGGNGNGQLGIGNSESTTIPVMVASHVAGMAAGERHAIFVKADGSVWTMGYNFTGALGDGTRIDRLSPVPVASGGTQVSAGVGGSLYSKADGTLWGMGAVFIDTIDNLLSPTQLATEVLAFANGSVHTMYVRTRGRLWAAGATSHGEFGNGENVAANATPALVHLGAYAISLSTYSSYWIGIDSSLWACGDNQYGQIGDGSTTTRYTAIPIVNTPSFVSAPPAPLSLAATRAGSSDPIVLSWKPVIGARSYEIWRGTNPNPVSATFLAQTVAIPRYEDLNAIAGVRYYYWVKAANVLLASGFSDADLGYRADPVVVTLQPESRSVGAGGTTALTVGVTGTGPLSYQWRKDGAILSGATLSILTLAAVSAADTGSYDVVVMNIASSVTSAAATLTVLPNPLGFTTRQFIGPAGATAYFAIEGAQTKHLLLRAVGPTLANFSVSNPLADPQITLLDANGSVLASNDNWGTGAGVDWAGLFNQVGAFALNPGSADAALYATLAPGAYQVRVNGVGGATGVALLELFDTDTNSSTRVAYLGVRGAVSPANGGFNSGLTITNSANKRLLLRAVGPTLGGPDTLADPQLQILDGAGVYATNDNWGDTAALVTAANQAGAFALNAGSADAAVLVNTRVGTGTYTAVAPSSGVGGDVLQEIYDLNAAGVPAYAPLIVVPPRDTTVSAGNAVSLRALGVGLGGAAYQWRKNGTGIAGATTPALTFFAQTTDSGSYDVRVTTAAGGATSSAANVNITPAVLAGSHAVVGSGYFAGGTVTISNAFTYPATATGLTCSVTLPAGWSYVSSTGAAGDVRPAAGATGTLTWSWTSLPALPLTFSYTLNAPAADTGTKTLAATLTAQLSDSSNQTVTVFPGPLAVNQITTHSADTDRNFRLSLLELTRVIELFNTRNGASRTGSYAVASAATEDGFVADPARASSAVFTLASYHSADSNRDGKLSLLELTRVIELYNCRSGATRTGQYHVQVGTEDNFASGP